MKTLNKFILTLFLTSFVLISCKEEILIEPSDKLGIVNITSDNKIPYIGIPFESTFTVTVKNPSGVTLYGNTNEFKDPSGQLKATILTNPDLLNPSNSNKIYIKVTGIPKNQEETIKIKLTKNDSLYLPNGKNSKFEPIDLKKTISPDNLYQNIQFFEALYKANRSGADFLDKKIKLSELTGTFEREFFATKMLTDLAQSKLLNDAIEGQNEYDRIKKTKNDFTFIIKPVVGRYNFEILNENGTNYYRQVFEGIMDENSKKYKTDIQVSIDPASWTSNGVEKTPIQINAVKTLLASLTESELKLAQTKSSQLDSTKFNLINQNLTPYTSNEEIKKDAALLSSIIKNFKTVEKGFKIQKVEMYFKMGKGFLVNYPESFLKEQNEIVIFKVYYQDDTSLSSNKVYTILYKTDKCSFDPTRLIYQAHFKEE